MHVRKLYILLLLPLFFACNPKNSPAKNDRPIPFVIDSGDVFLPNQLGHLDSMYTAHNQKTGNVIRLLTIRDFKPSVSLTAYSNKYFDSCGFGNDNTPNTILIVFCASCHRVEILAGKVREGVIDYPTLTKIIHDIMIPEFSLSHDYGGILRGSDTIIAMLEKPAH